MPLVRSRPQSVSASISLVTTVSLTLGMHESLRIDGYSGALAQTIRGRYGPPTGRRYRRFRISRGRSHEGCLRSGWGKARR